MFRARARDFAVELLKQANTLAGDFVTKELSIPVPATGAPFIAVYVPQEHKTSITEGGEPFFDVALTLHVEARAANADQDAVVSDLDTLIDQIQVGILSNPAFMRTTKAWPIQYVTDVTVRAQIDAEGEIYVGKALVAFNLTYRDSYAPADLPPLSAFDVSTTRSPPRPPPPEPLVVPVNISLEIP